MLLPPLSHPNIHSLPCCPDFYLYELENSSHSFGVQCPSSQATLCASPLGVRWVNTLGWAKGLLLLRVERPLSPAKKIHQLFGARCPQLHQGLLTQLPVQMFRTPFYPHKSMLSLKHGQPQSQKRSLGSSPRKLAPMLI